ncbi:MAG: hypothetical protein LBT01_01870 [Spirochaetaceae bacterium]|nr:hypothetical protein [Spirochaetaceae bacterium]
MNYFPVIVYQFGYDGIGLKCAKQRYIIGPARESPFFSFFGRVQSGKYRG